PSPCVAVAYEGGLIAAALGVGGVGVIDISDRNNPSVLHAVNVGGFVQTVAVAGQVVYAGMSSGDIAVIDMLTGQVLDERHYDGGTLDDLCLAGGYLFAIFRSGISPQKVAKIAIGGPPLQAPASELTLTFAPT